MLDFVSFYDALAPSLSGGTGGGGRDAAALSLLLDALKLAVPALQKAGADPADGVPRLARAQAVAQSLATSPPVADADTVAAGLLAEAVACGSLSVDAVRSVCGPSVAALVSEAVYVRTRPQRGAPFDDGAGALRSLTAFCESASDVRALVIDIAHRREALRWASRRGPLERAALALETVQTHAPVAHALASRTGSLRFELEDAAFEVLFPEAHAAVATFLGALLPRGSAALADAAEQLASACRSDPELASLLGSGEEEEAAAQQPGWGSDDGSVVVRARAKSRFSTMRKLLKDGRGADKVSDLLGLRVVLNACGEAGVAACYRAQALAHGLFPPVAGRGKDYVAKPKDNGYASLHSTLRLPRHGGEESGEGEASAGASVELQALPALPPPPPPLAGLALPPSSTALSLPVPTQLLAELQVRTAAMDAAAEGAGGDAAHWAYKAGAPPRQARQLAQLIAAAEAVAATRYAAFVERVTQRQRAEEVRSTAAAAGAAADTGAASALSRSPPERENGAFDAVGEAVFAAFDSNGDGEISLAEIAAFAARLGSDGPSGGVAEAAELMRLADADGDGRVTRAEFDAFRKRLSLLRALPGADAAVAAALWAGEGGEGAAAAALPPGAHSEAAPSPGDDSDGDEALENGVAPLALSDTSSSSSEGVVLSAVEARAASREASMRAVDALLAAGQLDGARALLRRTTAGDPSFAAAWTRWAGLEAEAGDVERAGELHASAAAWAADNGDKSKALRKAAKFWEGQGREDAARSLLSKGVVVAHAPGVAPDVRVASLTSLATFEARHGRADAARSNFEAARRAGPPSATTLTALGMFEATQRRKYAARVAFAAAAEVEPSSARVLLPWGVFEAKCRRLGAARDLFAAALQAHPRNAFVAHAWATAELRAGCTRAARALLDHALSVDPASPALWTGLSAVEDAEGRVAEARAAAAEAARVGPKCVPALLASARAEIKAGQLAPARSLLKAALAVEPDCMGVLAELAGVERREGRAAQAAQLEARALSAWRPPGQKLRRTYERPPRWDVKAGNEFIRRQRHAEAGAAPGT